LIAVPPYLRYAAVSAVALGIDVAAFLILMAGGTTAALASGVGYSIGIVVHWLLSSRLVFADRLAQRGANRKRQQGLFLASALAGLSLTMAIVGLGDLAGLDPRLAKLGAIAVSFNAVYLLRRTVVFVK